MLQIDEKLLVKDGEIILPLSYTPTPSEEKIFLEKNIRVKYTDSNGQLFTKKDDNFVNINPLKSTRTPSETLVYSAFPEVKTHTAFNAKENIFKGDIQIRFRGEIDDCIGHSLFLQSQSKNEKVQIWLNAVRSILGNIMATTVMNTQLEPFEIDGLSADIIHKYSHNPLKHLGYAHIVPSMAHGDECIRINTLRTKIRLLENTAFNIYTQEGQALRPDILSTINRLSSALYVLMIMLVIENNDESNKSTKEPKEVKRKQRLSKKSQ